MKTIFKNDASMPNDYFVTKHCISFENKRIYSKSNSNSESAYALGKIKYCAEYPDPNADIIKNELPLYSI